MAKREVSLVSRAAQTMFGVWGKSNDRTVAKDIPALSKRYHSAAGSALGSVLPFIVLSRNYDQSDGSFDLFIGSDSPCGGLDRYDLPEGLYGELIVRPTLGLLWGPAVGRAKVFFYTEWLPASPYTALNLEYEWHTEKSQGKRPEISLFFALEGEGAIST